MRNKLDDNVTYPFRSLEYLQLHFPKTSKLFFRREIDFPSPDGHYTIHKVFSDEQPTEDSKVTRSQLIDKRTGKVIKDLTAEDKGRWLYREGDVEWAPDSKGFLYFGEGPIKPEAYQLSGKSFVKIEVPSLDHMPLSGCDPKLGNAYPGLEKIHWSKPGTLVCKKTCYYKSTDVVARKGRQMLVSSLLFNVGVGNGAGRREDRSGKMNRRDSRYGFETRLLIRSLGRRGDLYLLCR